MGERKTDKQGLPRFKWPRIAVGIIAMVWVVSGTLKSLDTAGFLELLQQHNVIADRYRGYGMYLGLVEIVLGLGLVFALGSELRKLFGRAVLLVSLSVMIAFTVYLNMVDPVVLQESGCGCLSDYRIASGIEGSQFFIAMVRNGLLIGLHLFALIAPVIMMRRWRQSDANASA